MSEYESGLRSGPRRERASQSGEKWEFYKEWLKNPGQVGAIAPTGAPMARKMVTAVRPGNSLPVLELGPGTGVITRAILECGVAPDNLVSIEYSEAFLPGLRRRYPGVKFIHGNAFDMARLTTDLEFERFDTVISALPLMAMSVANRVHLVEAALDLLAPERPMVQFSYMPWSPAPARAGRYAVSRLATVVRNLPPAHIWVYQRLAETNTLNRRGLPVMR